MPTDLDSLSKVVERLERENRRLKSIGISLLILVCAALLTGQSQSPRTVEADSFVLRGPDGLIRAKLDTKNGSTELLFLNDAGQARVVIKSNEEGEGLEMRDDSGELLATMSVESPKLPHATSTIAALGNPAGPGVIMQASRDSAIVRVDDKNSRRVWAASSEPQTQR